MELRDLEDGDRPWARARLRAQWGSTEVARLGAVVDAADLAGLVAVIEPHRMGLLTYVRRDNDIEVVTIQSEREGAGVGRALMDGVLTRAAAAGVERIWLVTTNDNTPALRFYQRWGMDLVELIRHGVDASRRLKPTIPETGRDGIPLRHELVLERRLGDRAKASRPLGQS